MPRARWLWLPPQAGRLAPARSGRARIRRRDRRTQLRDGPSWRCFPFDALLSYAPVMAHGGPVRLLCQLKHGQETGNRIAALVVFMNDLFQAPHREPVFRGQAFDIAHAVAVAAALGKPVA